MKSERKNKLLNFLRMQAKPLSITEIYESPLRELFGHAHKTAQRDVGELLREGKLKSTGSNPARFTVIAPIEVNVVLTPLEIRELIKVAPTLRMKAKLSKALSDSL